MVSGPLPRDAYCIAQNAPPEWSRSARECPLPWAPPGPLSSPVLWNRVSHFSDRVDGRHHPDGQARLALQATGLRLPVVRDLRRARARSGTTARSGVELKKNVKDRWWRAMVHARDDIEGLDAAILMHPRVWEASGHVAGFTDPLVDCRQCKNRFRADDPRIKGTPGQPDAQCPVCGSQGHAHRAAAVQPDVQDLHGAGGGAGGRGLPAAGDGAGDLRQLPERAAELAAEDSRSASPRSARRSATRSRRATSSSGPASSSRWRCSSS